jgi:hypothetical protein
MYSKGFRVAHRRISGYRESADCSGAWRGVGYGEAKTLDYGPRLVLNQLVEDASGPIDWNCDTDSTDNPVDVDLTRDDIKENQPGQDDWENLVFNGGSIEAEGLGFLPRNRAAQQLLKQRLRLMDGPEELSIEEATKSNLIEHKSRDDETR